MDAPIWIVADSDLAEDRMYAIDGAFTSEQQAFDRFLYLKRTREPNFGWEIICTDLTSPVPEGY
jgi:hypothetical protein